MKRWRGVAELERQRKRGASSRGAAGWTGEFESIREEPASYLGYVIFVNCVHWRRFNRRRGHLLAQ